MIALTPCTRTRALASTSWRHRCGSAVPSEAGARQLLRPAGTGRRMQPTLRWLQALAYRSVKLSSKEPQRLEERSTWNGGPGRAGERRLGSAPSGRCRSTSTLVRRSPPLLPDHDTLVNRRRS